MRGGIPISRMNGTYGSEIDSRQKRIESIDWNRFAQDLNQETAVSKARKREAQSLIDQINAIVGNKKQSSAEEKLNSYKDIIPAPLTTKSNFLPTLSTVIIVMIIPEIFR